MPAKLIKQFSSVSKAPAFLRYFADSFDQAWGALEPLDVYAARHSH
ncbi:hypothetical protein P9869_30520 [Streptomyces ossamyceticus]|nr:hypothetical protein [Streptomyces ossamyceticus]